MEAQAAEGSHGPKDTEYYYSRFVEKCAQTGVNASPETLAVVKKVSVDWQRHSACVWLQCTAF